MKNRTYKLTSVIAIAVLIGVLAFFSGFIVGVRTAVNYLMDYFLKVLNQYGYDEQVIGMTIDKLKDLVVQYYRDVGITHLTGA